MLTFHFLRSEVKMVSVLFHLGYGLQEKQADLSL